MNLSRSPRPEIYLPLRYCAAKAAPSDSTLGLVDAISAVPLACTDERRPVEVVDLSSDIPRPRASRDLYEGAFSTFLFLSAMPGWRY